MSDGAGILTRRFGSGSRFSPTTLHCCGHVRGPLESSCRHLKPILVVGPTRNTRDSLESSECPVTGGVQAEAGCGLEGTVARLASHPGDLRNETERKLWWHELFRNSKGLRNCIKGVVFLGSFFFGLFFGLSVFVFFLPMKLLDLEETV